MSNIKEQMIELNKKLKKWAKEYYEMDKPSVSDMEYDAAYQKLILLEKENPKLKIYNSITDEVGGELDNRFRKVDHEYPMLSLSNAFNSADLLKFDKQIKDLLGTNKDIEYVVEYKIDGVSISVVYEDGNLKFALTRGNGITGEDVTHNVKTIKDIPHKINYSNKIEIRGEVYLNNEIFQKLNSTGENFANARNAAAGTLRQLDSKVAQKRELNAFMYSIPNPKEHDLKTHSDSLDFISENGINTNPDSKVKKNINEVIEFVEEIIQKRKDLNYEIDGIVIKVNDINTWQDIGYTAKFPKFMIAYKFPAEITFTKLIDIFPTVGRTGRITYNAKLSPIRLAGTTVQAATLHNADYIRDLNISIGDIVYVKKAGDIIPKVVKLKEKHNKEIWMENTECPACHSTLLRVEGEVDQYCKNDDCPQKNIAKLEHFVSRGAMNIEGLSKETLKTFIKEGIISDIASIYEIEQKVDLILNLPGFQTKSVNNLIEAIDKSRGNNIANFIFALGIRHVGSKNAKILAKRFGTLQRLMDVTEEQIIKIRDLGTKVSESVVKYFKNPNNINMIQRLKELGLKPQQIEQTLSNEMEGLTFVITGTLSQKRDYFRNLIESKNGNVTNSVTSKTDYLLAGQDPGTKYLKAKAMNIKIINEKDLKNIMEGNNE